MSIEYYGFKVNAALRYGVDEAILLHNVNYWCEKNKANGKHEHDGRFWAYNSIPAFAELFPFWTGKQVRRVIASCIEQGALLTGTFNEAAYDRTLWYALSDECLTLFNETTSCPNGQIHLPKRADPFAQTGRPIPKN